ncbi:MAG TPA: hypothetical protein PLZ95_03865 [Bryobacteraceae bacterium]|nr:hypothetical protein [Bryobacteraceae bacterium]
MELDREVEGVCNPIPRCFLLVALLLSGEAGAQDNPEGDSCEAVLARLESAFRSETIDKNRQAWLAGAVAGVSSAWRLVPEKAGKRVGVLDRELQKAEFRMPADLYRSTTALVQSLKGCSRSTEVGPVGEVAVTVLHQNPESIPEDWVRVGSGYEVYVDGESMGLTNTEGQLVMQLQQGSYEVWAQRSPNEAGSKLVDVEPGVTKQLTISLADDKQVFPPSDLRINDTEELVLPTPPNPVELSFWFEDAKIPLSEILYVGVESKQNPTGIDLTEDFGLVDSVATLTQTTRLSEFLAGAEGPVTLSFDARGVDDKDYSIIVEVWPSEGGVGVEPQATDPKALAPMPRAQIRLRHPKSGLTFYLPEGALEAQPVAMPRGEVDVEYGIGQVYRPLTRLNLHKTERVRLMRNPNGALTVTSPETKGADQRGKPELDLQARLLPAGA